MYCVWQENKEVINKINDINAEISECTTLKQNITEYVSTSSNVSTYLDCCYSNLRLGLSGDTFNTSFNNIDEYNKTLELERKKLENRIDEIDVKIRNLNNEKDILESQKYEQVCYEDKDNLTN